MLKLEKSPNQSNIAIRIREKEPLFAPPLLKALAIALVFHIGGLVLFHVSPFSFTSSFTFPPVHVQSESPSSAGVFASVSQQKENDEILSPPISLIPSLDWIAIFPESPLFPSLEFDLSTLESIEKWIWPSWSDSISLPLEEPRVQLIISGPLSELPLIDTDPDLNEMRPFGSHDSAAFVNYEVQLDRKTGEIFWFDRLESSGSTAVDQLTEKILLNLRFSPPLSYEPITGTLSFIVLP